MFTPSLDWGAELPKSLWWIATVWVYTAIPTLIILTLIGRYTTWGRQFWRITGGYFTGRESVVVWVWLSGILLSVIIGVRLDVLLSYQGNDMMSAAQTAFEGIGGGDQAVKDSGVSGFWWAWAHFAVLATVHVTRMMLDLFVTQRFLIRWRAWLTDHLTGDWLDGKAYYRSRFIDDTIDNPDQRIQSDIDVFTNGAGPLPANPNTLSANMLLFGAIEAIVSVASFAVILWNLSGELTMFDVTLPRAMFWIAIVYVVVATIIAFWIGRPLIQLTSTTRSSTPPSGMPWCDCATPPNRWPSTAARTPSGCSCGSDSPRS